MTEKGSKSSGKSESSSKKSEKKSSSGGSLSGSSRKSSRNEQTYCVSIHDRTDRGTDRHGSTDEFLNRVLGSDKFYPPFPPPPPAPSRKTAPAPAPVPPPAMSPRGHVPFGQRQRCYVKKPLISNLFEQGKVKCFCDWVPTTCYVPECKFVPDANRHKTKSTRKLRSPPPLAPHAHAGACVCQGCQAQRLQKEISKKRKEKAVKRKARKVIAEASCVMNSSSINGSGHSKKHMHSGHSSKNSTSARSSKSLKSRASSRKRKGRASLKVQLGGTVLVFDNVQVQERS